MLLHPHAEQHIWNRCMGCIGLMTTPVSYYTNIDRSWGKLCKITPRSDWRTWATLFPETNPRWCRGKYRPTVSSQRGELFCTISRLKSSQYLFYITHKNILVISCFLWKRNCWNFNLSKCQPKKSNASTMQAHRSGPSLGLVKLSSKSTVEYSNSTIKFVIDKVFNILTVSFNAC